MLLFDFFLFNATMEYATRNLSDAFFKKKKLSDKNQGQPPPPLQTAELLLVIRSLPYRTSGGFDGRSPSEHTSSVLNRTRNLEAGRNTLDIFFPSPQN